MDCCASTRTSPHALHARGLHTSQPLGPTSAAEQEGHLRSPVPHQCGDPSRSGARSKTSRCGDRLLQCVAYLEPTTQSPSASPYHHSRRRPLTRSHPLGSLPKQILPPQESVTQSLSRQIRQRSRAGFPRRSAPLEGNLKLLAKPKIFAAWLRPLYRKYWVVYLKRPFGGPEYVLQYLGRYTHRVAISNHRLVSFIDGQVTFRWRDSADHNKQKLRSLPVGKFLSRFLLHLLPQGFVRIRHFGFLATRRRAKLLPLCFQLLGATQQPSDEQHTSSTEDSPDLYPCPKCGRPMRVIERLTAAQIQLRSPPRTSAAA